MSDDYEVYSKRRKRLKTSTAEVYQYDEFPQAFRIQIVYIWDDAIGPYSVFDPIEGDVRDNSASARVWDGICNKVAREQGVFDLVEEDSLDPEDECKKYLFSAPAEGILDLIEVSFRAIPQSQRTEAVSELNYRFREHDLGYQFVKGEIVRVDSQYIHAEAVKPALSLLNTSNFEYACMEFLKAHEHYRKGRSSEAMSEALKAFESTMKCICEEKDWSYPANATAKKLIATILDNGLIPRYMEPHLAGVRQSLEAGLPTVRNKNSGHGQGSQDRDIPNYLAAYALHLAATNIVFLVEAHQSQS